MLVRINTEVKEPLNKTLKFGFDDVTLEEMFPGKIEHIGFLKKTKEDGVYNFTVDRVRPGGLTTLTSFSIADRKLMERALVNDYGFEGAYEIL